MTKRETLHAYIAAREIHIRFRAELSPADRLCFSCGMLYPNDAEHHSHYCPICADARAHGATPRACCVCLGFFLGSLAACPACCNVPDPAFTW